jgi:inosine/xanthosine triphosphate pyrophosphatase family protein
MKTTQLAIGTGNPAKIQMVQSALIPLQIQVVSAGELGVTLEIEEDGRTAQENSRKKSLLYAATLKQPVLSTDHALYLDGLSAAEQPGVNTRKVDLHDGRATDSELLDYYVRTLRRMGGKTGGRWEFAFCIADETGRCFEKTILSPRLFVSTPSRTMIPGFPLESIQISPTTGQYLSEMTRGQQDAFWQEVFGAELCEFVSQALSQLGVRFR